jgi:predicted phosphodiesterase
LSNIEWKVDAVKLAEGGLSWRAIAKELDVPRTTVSDFLRKHFDTNFEQFTKPTEVHMIRKADKEEDNSRILLISDLHIPYHHKDSIAFLKHLKEKYNPTRVICLGDEVDAHALSYHDHDPDLPSAGDELRRAMPVIQELHKIFPKMDIIESNHGSLIWRKAKTNGIPKHYIKSYNDVLGVDDGWKWSYDLTVKLPNGTYCYIHHGKSNDVIKASQLSGMSAVQGHYHEKFKIDYWGNATGLYFGLQCGCLIDDDAYAFSYNNCNLKRPVIGTGLIIDSQPILEPLIMDTEGNWIGPRS